MQKNDWIKNMAREDLGRCLAACFYQPGPEMEEERLFSAITAASAQVGLESEAQALARAYAAATQDELQLDYSRLFLGPFDIPAKPYGSVWLEGETVVMGDSTLAVRELYREGGFDIAEDFRELPDHVAAELEFLYLLTFQENEARRTDDDAALERAGEVKSRFLGEHLGRWIGAFAEAIRGSARTDFYRRLAVLVEKFVQLEAAAVARLC